VLWLTIGLVSDELNVLLIGLSRHLAVCTVHTAGCAMISNYTHFGRPFVKPFAQCYRTVVCPVCLRSWCIVAKRLGWMDQDETCRRLDPGHIVLDGDSAPLHKFPKTGTANFRPMAIVANDCMDQDATGIGLRQPTLCYMGTQPYLATAAAAEIRAPPNLAW